MTGKVRSFRIMIILERMISIVFFFISPQENLTDAKIMRCSNLFRSGHDTEKMFSECKHCKTNLK